MGKETIRDMLPKSSLDAFDDIVLFRILGASKHIKVIFEIFVDIAQNNDEEKAKKVIEQVRNYFIDTRGKSSYAVVNALVWQKQLQLNAEGDSFLDKVKNSVNEYFIESENNIQKIVEYSSNYLKNKKTVMIFDYSSSVEKAVIGVGHNLEVIIPESRVINGGYPFVRMIKEKGHHIHFIPDSAMLSVLNKVEAIYIGAETFYPDGTAFNTTGSDILAELAKIYHVPYLVITPLLKADLRSLKGIYKEPIIRNMDGVINKGWPADLSDDVDFTTLELTEIKPDKIDYYITEKGIVKPSNLLNLVYKEF